MNQSQNYPANWPARRRLELGFAQMYATWPEWPDTWPDERCSPVLHRGDGGPTNLWPEWPDTWPEWPDESSPVPHRGDGVALSFPRRARSEPSASTTRGGRWRRCRVAPPPHAAEGNVVTHCPAFGRLACHPNPLSQGQRTGEPGGTEGGEHREGRRTGRRPAEAPPRARDLSYDGCARVRRARSAPLPPAPRYPHTSGGAGGEPCKEI